MEVFHTSGTSTSFLHRARGTDTFAYGVDGSPWSALAAAPFAYDSLARRVSPDRRVRDVAIPVRLEQLVPPHRGAISPIWSCPSSAAWRSSQAINAADPDVPVIIITAHGTVDSAVEAIKLGAFDYITKPFDQRSSSTSWPRRSAPTRSARRNARGETRPPVAGRRVAADAGRAPDHRQGRGHALHRPHHRRERHRQGARSPPRCTRAARRRDKPFIRINCAAIPQDLIESELFGYERGAFTGAVTSKPGRFELADGGTLFLDEIGEIPVEMQVKLLRALQEGEFERVGGIKTTRVDVRLIAATNRDLEPGDRGWALPQGPRTTGWRSCPSTSRRCASGRATSPCSCVTSSTSTTAA